MRSAYLPSLRTVQPSQPVSVGTHGLPKGRSCTGSLWQCILLAMYICNVYLYTNHPGQILPLKTILLLSLNCSSSVHFFLSLRQNYSFVLQFVVIDSAHAPPFEPALLLYAKLEWRAVAVGRCHTRCARVLGHDAFHGEVAAGVCWSVRRSVGRSDGPTHQYSTRHALASIASHT